jgi:hypothetical protein
MPPQTWKKIFARLKAENSFKEPKGRSFSVAADHIGFQQNAPRTGKVER